jgi:hypothetical protein
MLKGLQTHFADKGLLGAEKCQRIAEIGVQLGRIDAQSQEPEPVQAQCNELAAVGIPSYVIVNDPRIISELPVTVYGVEYLNEPDGRIEPSDYRRGLAEIAHECKLNHLEFYGPCVSNLIRTKVLAEGAELRGIEYIEACAPYPHGMKGSIHRYGDDDNVSNPHKGFKDREHEVLEMHRALGVDRPFGVSELGWASCGTLSEEEAGANMLWEVAFWNRMKALFLIFYQIHDGPGEDNASNFGLFRIDGTVKEAYARAFK